MEASQATAKRVSPGEVVSETFSIYGQNLGVLLGSSVAVFLVIGLIEGLARNTGGALLGILAGLVSLAGHALYVGFVVRLVEDVRDGKRDHTVGDLFSAASPMILPLIGFGILFAIGVTIGFILLIVPGLILLTIWSVGAPAIVVERVGAIDAFGRSRRLVKGEGWSVFGALLLVLLIVIVISFVLAAIATPIGNGEAATLVASVISGVITAPIFALAVTVMYFNLAGAAAPAVPAAPEPPPPPPAPTV
jgi:hypothetical protein